MRKYFCSCHFFWFKTICTDLNGIFRIRLLFHRLHAVFQRRSCQIQHRCFSGRIGADFLEHIIRYSRIRNPHSGIFHRAVISSVLHRHLQPSLIRELVEELQGTIVECNTAYAGRRNTTGEHWKAIAEHGFLDIAPCDIMDEDGELSIPVNGGKHLTENFVGAHLQRYDSMLLLSHFKGHAMGGFGGALKNMSIGVASAHGKAHIHGVGVPENLWTADHDSFLECMAEADKAVMDYLGRENLLYINVANRLSVDCDCDSHPKEPEMADLGIFASVDPVALDQACVDHV